MMPPGGGRKRTVTGPSLLRLRLLPRVAFDVLRRCSSVLLVPLVVVVDFRVVRHSFIEIARIEPHAVVGL